MEIWNIADKEEMKVLTLERIISILLSSEHCSSSGGTMISSLVPRAHWLSL